MNHFQSHRGVEVSISSRKLAEFFPVQSLYEGIRNKMSVLIVLFVGFKERVYNGSEKRFNGSRSTFCVL